MVKLSTPRPVKAVWQDVTASRALGTIYQNTSGRPIMVSAAVRMDTGAGCAVQFESLIGPSSPPTLSLGYSGLVGPANENLYGYITFIVPNNYYYKIQIVVGAGVMAKWLEVEL
mgnify:CR=1 FL=1